MQLTDMNICHQPGIKCGEFRAEVAIHTPVDRGNVKVDAMNRLLNIIRKKLD